MKQIFLLALLGLTSITNAAPQTRGCITMPNDESTIQRCQCHPTCKMCGYSSRPEQYFIQPSDMPTADDQCITCNPGNRFVSGTRRQRELGRCVSEASFAGQGQGNLNQNLVLYREELGYCARKTDKRIRMDHVLFRSRKISEDECQAKCSADPQCIAWSKEYWTCSTLRRDVSSEYQGYTGVTCNIRNANASFNRADAYSSQSGYCLRRSDGTLGDYKSYTGSSSTDCRQKCAEYSVTGCTAYEFWELTKNCRVYGRSSDYEAKYGYKCRFKSATILYSTQSLLKQEIQKDYQTSNTFRIYFDRYGKKSFGYNHEITAGEPEQNMQVGSSVQQNRVTEALDKDIKTTFVDLIALYSNFETYKTELQIVLAMMCFDVGKDRMAGYQDFANSIKRGDYRNAARLGRVTQWYQSQTNRQSAENRMRVLENLTV